MSEVKAKEVKLYAFSVYSSEGKLTKSHASITKWLQEKLQDSKLDDRCMKLSLLSDDSDEDFIGDYSKLSNSSYVYGTLFRITPSENVPSFTDELLTKSTISMAEIESLSKKNGVRKAYKNHLYFYITDDIIITNTSSAKKLETYLNWYLEVFLLENYISIRPRVKKIDKTTLGSLKELKIEEPKRPKKAKSLEKEKSKTTVKTMAIVDGIKEKVLNLLVKDYGLDKLTADNFNDVVRVQLSILIAQNTDVMPNSEAARKTLESVLNVVSNDALEFVGKKGARIKSEEMQIRKDVSVELSSNGFLNEPSLYKEMKIFRSEIN